MVRVFIFKWRIPLGGKPVNQFLGKKAGLGSMVIDVENSAFALGRHEYLADGRLRGFNEEFQNGSTPLFG
jgi:hypothetical protein